jgi:hypothetical protein
MSYESKFAVGERVILNLRQPGTPTIFAFVRAVTFSSSKIRYALFINEGAETTLHNVDSFFVEPVSEADKATIDFTEDNYS